MSISNREQTLRGVDLNLLPVLGVLLKERNVTRAAERLNMTQSAVSEALKRLRYRFGDELLVRVGRKMAPTSYAQSLLPQLEQLLRDTENLLKPEAFNPAREKREFLIATGDNVVMALGNELIKRLSEKAPQASIQFINIQYMTRRDLETGWIDLLIIPRGLIPQKIFDEDGLKRMKIFHESWVCISRSNHPRLSEGLTIELLNSLPTVACKLDETSYLYGKIPGRDTTEQIRVSQFMLLPLLVAHGDAIAMVQRHVAEQFLKFLPLDIFELPISFPELDLFAYWADIHDQDRMHSWLRNELADIVDNSEASWFPKISAR